MNSSPPTGREGSVRCYRCKQYLPEGARFGRGINAILDKAKGTFVVYCDDCYHEIMMETTREKREREREKAAMEKKADTFTRRKARRVLAEEEDEEDDDEEEDEGDDEFKDFFKSITGKAIKLMFRHIERRISDLEKKTDRNW